MRCFLQSSYSYMNKDLAPYLGDCMSLQSPDVRRLYSSAASGHTTDGRLRPSTRMLGASLGIFSIRPSGRACWLSSCRSLVLGTVRRSDQTRSCSQVLILPKYEERFHLSSSVRSAQLLPDHASPPLRLSFSQCRGMLGQCTTAALYLYLVGIKPQMRILCAGMAPPCMSPSSSCLRPFRRRAL